MSNHAIALSASESRLFSLPAHLFAGFILPTLLILASIYSFYAKRSSVISTKRAPAPERQLKGHEPSRSEAIAEIRQLFIHPIKSCKGISVQEVSYSPIGFEHDRTFLIVDASTNRLVTARKVPKMILIEPSIHKDDDLPHGGFLTVSFPQDSGCPEFTLPLNPTSTILRKWKHLDAVHVWSHSTDAYICQSFHEESWSSALLTSYIGSRGREEESPSSILSRYIGFPVLLVYKGPKPRAVDGTAAYPKLSESVSIAFQDGYPILFVSEQSRKAVEEKIRDLVQQNKVVADEKWATDVLPIERFRPNVVMTCTRELEPFFEDELTHVAVGEHPPQRFTFVSKCDRCLLPNVDIRTGIKDKVMPFRALEDFRKVNPDIPSKVYFGCNAITRQAGTLRIGDRIYNDV